jgi:hypothetical protein
MKMHGEVLQSNESIVHSLLIASRSLIVLYMMIPLTI